MKNVVVIGGGTGVYTVLSGLREYPYHLSAIVSMADDGGSTGVLREEFGILPPGDIRRALIALSHSDKILAELFNYRFKEGIVFRGHSLGNLLLTALERITGSFDKAVKEAVKILNVKGQVIPVTLGKTKLHAELENGKIIKGETNIDVPKHDGTLAIKRIFLKPSVSANKDALEAIAEADAIILGPGDLYTSILPNLIVDGISNAIKHSSAKKIYIVNIMTKFGETYGFSASDFLRIVQDYLEGDNIDYCVINTQKSSDRLLVKYKAQRDEFVVYNKNDVMLKYKHIVAEKLLRRGQFLRHDPEKLAKLLSTIIDAKEKRKGKKNAIFGLWKGSLKTNSYFIFFLSIY